MPGLLASPATITVSLDFLDPNLKEKPFTWLNAASAPAGATTTNIEPWPIETVITDVRSIDGFQEKFTVETSGFQYVEHESLALQNIDTPEGVVAYYAETEKLLLAVLPGAKRVKMFNSTVRRKKHNAPAEGTGRGPVARAHVDNTPSSGAQRVLTEMGDEGKALSAGRCQIVNVWRPLEYPAVDCPLAAMDYRSLDWKDLRATDLILSNEGGRKGENYSVISNVMQKWYYMSEQSPSEPIIFKIYDSLIEDGVSRLTPHSAFVNRHAPKDALSRQSVEVRALVFY